MDHHVRHSCMRLDITSCVGVMTLHGCGSMRRMGTKTRPHLGRIHAGGDASGDRHEVTCDVGSMHSRSHEMDILYLNHDARRMTVKALMKLGPF